MQINPRDRAILQNLAALEQAGENGFSTYNSGDIKTGSQQIKESLQDSSKSINSIHDPELRKQAKALLNSANQAIREYMKNPTDDNLSTLKDDVDAYKDFLNDNQG